MVTVGPSQNAAKRARLALAASDASQGELPPLVHIPVKGPTHLPSGRRRRRPPLWAMLIDEADGVYAVCSEGGRFRTFTHCICIQDAEGNLKAKCEQEKCIR